MNGYVWKRAGGMEKEGRLKRKYVARGWEMSISSEKAYGSREVGDGGINVMGIR